MRRSTVLLFAFVVLVVVGWFWLVADALGGGK